MFNLNVRRLPKNIDKVKHFLEGLHYNFSILSFTETWLCDYNISTHNFNGYTHLFKTRGNNKVGGGVLMFINSRINYLCRDDIKLDLEFIDVLAIAEIPKDELNTKNNIIIISLYRPPSIQAKLFIDKFTELLQFLNRENKYIFILGDFNVDTSSAMINPNITVNNFQNMFLSYFYSPLIDKFTRVDEKRGTSSLLDIILYFILYIHVCFSLFSTTLYFIYYVFTFKFFTLISALPNNINSTVKYIYTCQYPISYKSFNLQIINSSLSVCIHRYMYDMYLPYRTKSYFLYNSVCLCYIMFLKLLRILLNVCIPKYHSLYMNYFLYNHATCPLTVSMMYMDT